MRPKFIGKNGTKAKGRNEHSLDETGWWTKLDGGMLRQESWIISPAEAVN
jgi:hypothetical protein